MFPFPTFLPSAPRPTFVLRPGMRVRVEVHGVCVIRAVEETKDDDKEGGVSVHELDTAKTHGILILHTPHGGRWCWTSAVLAVVE